MTTRTPRVGVTLSEEDRDLVQRLAAIENTSASKVIAGIVAEFRPVMRQIVELGEASRNLTDSQRSKLQAMAAEMESGVMGKSTAALDAFNEALGEARRIVDGE